MRRIAKPNLACQTNLSGTVPLKELVGDDSKPMFGAKGWVWRVQIPFEEVLGTGGYKKSTNSMVWGEKPKGKGGRP